MKKLLKIFALVSIFVLTSCYSKIEPIDIEVSEDVNYSFVETLSVPLGTNEIFIEYNVQNEEPRVTSIPVSPELVKPTDGKDAEPWGSISLSITSPVKTVFNAYYYINGKKVELIENGIINKIVPATKAASTVMLDEPKKYETSDLGCTFYHSSGSVMFEDCWPNMLRVGSGPYDSDFNDVVIDYDLECTVVPDENLKSEGWREQVKVVLHLRAMSGTNPARVGVILEGFDQKYVDEIEDHCSLDSWQNPHGKLPTWTEVKIQENSLHYESNPLRPCVEIGGIGRMNQNNSGAGTEEYTRVNDNGETFTTVFNPKINNYWKSPKTEQYSPELNTMTLPLPLSTIQKNGYYNVIPGYMNVGGGLYTYTVIYHMKPRSEMSADESKACLENMMNAVYETLNQNFYIIRTDFVPVGLKGYQPGDFKVKGYNSYLTKYNEVASANADKLYPNVTYCSADGLVWAFKAPTLTRHTWNKLYFSSAYPHYLNWVDTDGEEDADWYMKDVDSRYLVCWW